MSINKQSIIKPEAKMKLVDGEKELEIESIGVIDCGPNDKIIIRFPEYMCMEQIDGASNYLKSMFPDNAVVFMHGGTRLEVLREAK
jgi:hypothetical protein